MPTYCYSRFGDPTIFEKDFPLGKAPEEIPIFTLDWGEDVAYRNRQAELSSQHAFVKGSKTPVKSGYGTWPMAPCVASGVHPDQAQDLRDHLKEHGCPTEVTKGGDPIYESAVHQEKALKCRGMNDRSSYS